MASFDNKFKSAKQDWETPQDLFDAINAEFAFTLDAAAAAHNAKAPVYFTEEDDGIQQSWQGHTVWLNPPYGATKGKLSDWIAKAKAEAALGDATVVMLIPARTNTKWFHDLCLKHAEVRLICGRPKFGGADHGLPQPLCLVVFRPPGTFEPTVTSFRYA